MQRRILAQIMPWEYESSGIESVFKPNIMAEGSRNVVITGKGKPQAFKGLTVESGKVGARYLTQAGDSYAGLGGFGDANIKGSAARVLAALFFAGDGTLYYDGISLSATASSILQLKLLASGAFGTTYQAGLSQPSAPTIATRTTLGVGMSGKLKAGTYTVKAYKIRSATGARSIASPASNIAIVVESNDIGQSLRVSLPAADVNGGDRWGICVTPRNFGTTGPYFLYREVAESALTTIDGVPRSYEIEWTDGDLVGQPLAPIESYPPPACVFVGALGNSTFVDGCYGDVVDGVSASAPGTVIASSLPLRPEEFPLDWLSFPPDAPTALLRGGDGFYYRFGKNSMGVISYSGGTPAIIYQLYWGTTGVSYPHNAVVDKGGRLYAKTGKQGLIRIGANGQPDSLWATAFLDDVLGWADEDTVLGSDDTHIYIMNDLAVIPFNTDLDAPGAPIDLTGKVSGKILSAVTHLGTMYISCLDAANAAIKLYKFGTGTGSVMEVYSDWFFPDQSVTVKQIDIKMRSDTVNPVTIKVFKNEDRSTPILSITKTPAIGAPIRLAPWAGFLPDCRSFCVYAKQTTAGGDAGFEWIAVKGFDKGVVK
jgi:hypothetical protein